jgi:hypothetical protein
MVRKEHKRNGKRMLKRNLKLLSKEILKKEKKANKNNRKANKKKIEMDLNKRNQDIENIQVMLLNRKKKYKSNPTLTPIKALIQE